MTPSKLDEEAMRPNKKPTPEEWARKHIGLFGTKEHQYSAMAGNPLFATCVRDLLLVIDGLREENGRMRKGLEESEAVIREHAPGHSVLIEEIRSILGLTPTPAVEAKAKCGRCGGSGYALAGREPTWMPCPDCATEGETKPKSGEPCPKCRGSGFDGKPGPDTLCPACCGSGKHYDCPRCADTGEIAEDDGNRLYYDDCPDCATREGKS